MPTFTKMTTVELTTPFFPTDVSKDYLDLAIYRARGICSISYFSKL
jgi:hypothetical protein